MAARELREALRITEVVLPEMNEGKVETDQA
jgi:hypothetical protein